MRLSAGRVAVGIALLWAVLHLAHYGRFIYHDGWMHNFPMLYGFARQAGCAGLPSWLWSPDSGTPTIIYLISASLTQILRVPTLLLLGCLQGGVVPAIYIFKAAVYLSYLALAFGMYVFGRLALERRISAAYLFAATLFAGLCLDAAHSDQVVTITFWLPWIAACGVLYHRHYHSPSASRYLNLAALFMCLQAFDQYPHFPVIALGAAVAIYAALERQRALAVLRQHWWRLWPSALALALTVCHFLVFKNTIADYAPSLRSGLVVDPALMSESGFVQPTALIGSILPQSLLAGGGELRGGMGSLLAYFGAPAGENWFIFPLDELVFHVGIIPVVLSIVFLLRPGMTRLRLGWTLWVAFILAVSLQQTGLYLVFFRFLPFFDLFRSYFLFSLFAVLGVLVTSAYGLDAALTLPDEARRTTLLRAGVVVFFLVLAALLALTVIALFHNEPRRLLAALEAPLARDLLLVALAFIALWYASRPKIVPALRALALIGPAVLSQAVYTTDVYAQLAISEPQLLARLGLDRADTEALDAALRSDPEAIQRKLCAVFSECYLSRRPSVSLRRDLDGTFLRPRRSPVFAPGLSLPVVEALTGLTMPVFWASRHLEPITTDAALVKQLNAHDEDITRHLRDVAYVGKDDFERLTASQNARDGWANEVAMRELEWGRNAVGLSYAADAPALLNAAITCTPHWKATVNGKDIPVVCANFSGLLLRLPAGAGTVELRYVDGWSDFVFESRYALLMIALLGAVLLARASFARVRDGVP